AGETKDDPTFGTTEIYRGQLSVALAAAELRGERRVLVSYQGCSEKGVCFPPQIAAVDLDTLTTATASPRAAVGLPLSDNGNGSESSAGQGEAQAAGALSGPLPIVLISFLGLGILLAFTPCVLPMIPIVVGIVVGSDRPASWRRGAFLSATYALGMAIAYASLGAVAAWSGDNLQLALQTPPMISLAAAVFVALALSSFGVFDLQLPARWLAKGNSGTKATGGFFGAAILGFTSALIVGPCVTPPLAAALLYVTQDGDAIRGAAALFALGLGMGIPVVLAGTFGNRVLPKSGPWLLQVRRLFGVVFLALAIFMLGRVVPPNVTLGLWGALGIGLAIFLGATDRPRLPTNLAAKLAKAAGVIALIYGSTLIVGFAGGADDPLRPLAFLR
ncbi:MAG: protein-disulfide reductase DsbD, partial [Rhizobiales bacterium]|nr:protein-disulfide reductase DsbD [Hyphomicrobiales bacterium]